PRVLRYGSPASGGVSNLAGLSGPSTAKTLFFEEKSQLFCAADEPERDASAARARIDSLSPCQKRKKPVHHNISAVNPDANTRCGPNRSRAQVTTLVAVNSGTASL